MRLWHYVHFAAADFDFIHVDFALRRTSYHSVGVHIELRSMPWALDGATDQGAIGQRSAFVHAMIAEGHHAFGAASYHNTFVRYANQHHLPLAQLTLIACRPPPAIEFALLEFAGIGIAMVHADLIAVGERSS